MFPLGSVIVCPSLAVNLKVPFVLAFLSFVIPANSLFKTARLIAVGSVTTTDLANEGLTATDLKE